MYGRNKLIPLISIAHTALYDVNDQNYAIPFEAWAKNGGTLGTCSDRAKLNLGLVYRISKQYAQVLALQNLRSN